METRYRKHNFLLTRIFEKVFIILAATVLGSIALYSLVQNIAYICTEKETIGWVKEIQEKRKVYIIISYNNVYQGENVVGKVALDYQKSANIAVGDEIKVYYQKYFDGIYTDYRKPMMIPLIIINLFLLLIVVYVIMPVPGKPHKKKKNIIT